MTELTFAQWLSDLDAIAETEGCKSYTTQAGRDCFWNSYQDGVSPTEAWANEKDAAHSLGCVP